jgi:hypothetical protein
MLFSLLKLGIAIMGIYSREHLDSPADIESMLTTRKWTGRSRANAIRSKTSVEVDVLPGHGGYAFEDLGRG